MILCFTISIFLNYKFLDNLNDWNSYIAIDIIVSLLPTVITVVSICLSLSKEKIYGVEINEFNKLRCSFVYKFLEMMIIAILIFGSCFIVKLLNLKISVIVLNAISIFYTLYFCIQEIPIMAKNDGRLMSIVRSYLKKDKNMKAINYYDDDNVLAKVLAFIMFNKGPLFIVKSFRDSRLDIVYNLLEAQNSYLYKVAKNISALKSYPNDEFEGIDILKSINKSYENVAEIFRSNDVIKYLDYCINDENYIVSLTRPLYSLHHITHSIGLERNEKECINHLLWIIYCVRENNEIASFQFLNAMLMSSLPSGDMWFLKAIRDVDFPNCFFDLDKNVYGYFALMYICFAVKSGMLSEITVLEINKCLNEQSQSINGRNSLLKTALRGIEYINDQYVLEMIIKLIKIYDSSRETRFYINSNSRNEEFSNIAAFSKENLFNYWLELILFNPYVYLKSDAFIDVINKLSDKDKETFFYLIDREWINNDGLKDNEHTSFLSFLGIRPMMGINYHNEEIIKLLKDEKNKFFSSAEENRINQNIIDDSKLNEYKKKIGDGFKKSIEIYPLLNKEIDLENTRKFYYSLRVETDSIDDIINMFIKQFSNAISNSVRERLLKSDIIKKSLKDYIFSDDEIKEVIEFKPENMSARSSILYKCNDREKEILEKVYKIEDSYLPNNLFWKGNAIGVNIEYCDEDSSFRKLTAMEINNIIEREYEKVGTLYKYSRFSNTDSQSFLVSREKLEELLSKRYLVSIVVFKQEFAINGKNILYFKHETDGE